MLSHICFPFSSEYSFLQIKILSMLEILLLKYCRSMKVRFQAKLLVMLVFFFLTQPHPLFPAVLGVAESLQHTHVDNPAYDYVPPELVDLYITNLYAPYNFYFFLFFKKFFHSPLARRTCRIDSFAAAFFFSISFSLLRVQWRIQPELYLPLAQRILR